MKQGDAILFLLEWCPCKLEGCQTIDAKRDCQDILLLQCDSTGLAMIPVYDGCNSALCTIHVPYPSSTRVYPGAVWVGMPPCPIQSQGMWPGYLGPQFYVWPLGHPADWKPCLPYLLGLPLPVNFEGQKIVQIVQHKSYPWGEESPGHCIRHNCEQLQSWLQLKQQRTIHIHSLIPRNTKQMLTDRLDVSVLSCAHSSNLFSEADILALGCGLTARHRTLRDIAGSTCLIGYHDWHCMKMKKISPQFFLWGFKNSLIIVASTQFVSAQATWDPFTLII